MKKEKTKPFTSVIDALDYLDKLRAKKITGFLNATASDGSSWAVRWKVKE